MKFSYVIDTERRLIFQRYEGQLTLTRLINCLQLVWADPAYNPTYDGFVDVSQVSPRASMADVKSFIDFVRVRPEHSRGRWAIVVDSPFMTVCGMLYQKALDSHHVLEVFSTTEAACSFLRIGSPSLPEALLTWRAN